MQVAGVGENIRNGGPMARKNKSDNMLLKAASLYYEHKLTQEQVAKRLGVSRPTIVRMLKQAVDEGHVIIKMAHRLPHHIELETEIEAMLGDCGLRQVIVAEGTDSDTRVTVARQAALLLENRLRAGDTLGIGWSSTLMNVVPFLRKGKFSPERVVQLGGYVSDVGNASAQDISIRMGEILRSPVASLPAPVLVSSQEVRDALMIDPAIASAMEWVSKCNIGIVGIGVATTDSTLVRTGYLSEDEVQEAKDKGAIGDILSHYYTLDGQEIATSWSNRMISVDMNALQAIDNLIGVAAGADKAEAVIGAVRCGILNTLVLDTELAEAIVQH
jgi:DNA-binding transcriptional regulator LsrR (DeoR family)